MSRIYDSWERLVGAVLKREEDRQLALCESFSSSNSSRFSFNFNFNPVVRDFRNDFRNFGERLDPADLSSQETFVSRNVMAIEYGELKKATKNFHPSMLLGEGAFGSVYKGWIHEDHLTATKPGCGITVAIKKINLGSFQGKELLDKIHYLSQLRHPNLIKLVGYSFSAKNRILVYEYMCKGSLDNHLFRRGHNSLNWETRVKVAIGAARAIAFLHDLEIPVIHRNIKSSYILLDGDFNTKLSGFGIAKDGPVGDMNHVSTRVMGTYGYAAPEYYMSTGDLTTRCDVYGFGAVLLELLSGRRFIDPNRPAGERILSAWAKPYLNGKKRLPQIVDSRLEGNYPPNQAYEVAKISLQCLSVEPRYRPKMYEVVGVLEKM